MSPRVEKYLELRELLSDPNANDGTMVDQALDEMDQLWNDMGVVEKAELNEHLRRVN